MTWRCGYCDCQEGELHGEDCDFEECPFCGGHLMSCNCRYKQLGYTIDRTAKYSGLPVKIYKEGLDSEQNAQWMQILERKGRIPYIYYPSRCPRCGEVTDCGMFMVPDWQWERYISPRMRNAVLCRECYDEIKRLIDERANLPEPEMVPCPECQLYTARSPNMECPVCHDLGVIAKTQLASYEEHQRQLAELRARLAEEEADHTK